MSTLSEIAEVALRLPETDRWRLAEDLLSSLPSREAPSSMEETLEEARRRDREMDADPSSRMDEATFWAGLRG